MQCIHKSYIYSIDKKKIEEDYEFWCKSGILNTKNIISLGDGVWWKGVERMFTGKWWVYYNRSPRHSKYKLHRKLFQLGYFKYNEVGCGKCEICRTEHSKEWATKAYCENKCWKNKVFLTLTYDNYWLRMADGKLKRSDLQQFWKNLRYHLTKSTKAEPNGRFPGCHMEELPSNIAEDWFGFNSKRKNKKVIRYINCGEYGPKTKRAHYHAVVFNFKPDDLRRYKRDRRGYWLYTSAKINKIWGKGYVIIGNATQETAAYVARYCTKKYARDDREQARMKRRKQVEFIGASSWGFIGYYWWINHKDEIKEAGGILMKTKKGVHLAKIPKVMINKMKIEDEDWFELYDVEKNRIGEENWKKILSKTTLSEEEYIKETYRQRRERYKKLRRDAV